MPKQYLELTFFDGWNRQSVYTEIQKEPATVGEYRKLFEQLGKNHDHHQVISVSYFQSFGNWRPR